MGNSHISQVNEQQEFVYPPSFYNPALSLLSVTLRVDVLCKEVCQQMIQLLLLKRNAEIPIVKRWILKREYSGV